MSGVPRARAFIEMSGTTSFRDVQQMMPPHLADIPHVGEVVMHHAVSILTGRVSDTGHDDALRPCLYIASPGCPCGCEQPGLGLVYTFSVDEMRAIAIALVKLADEDDAAAATQAAAALAKAAAK